MAINCNQPQNPTSSCNTPNPNEISHQIEIDEDWKITVLKPLIDTIGVTLRAKEAFSYLCSPETDASQLADAYWDEFGKRIASLAEDPEIPIAWANKPLPSYKKSVNLQLGPETSIKLSVEPKKQTDQPLRLEWNPSAMTAEAFEAWEDLWGHIDIGGDLPFRALFRDARITRLDIAVDVLNLPLADLVVAHDEVWKIWMCTSMQHGAETFQFYRTSASHPSPFLSPKKRANLLVYDKRKEQLAHDLEPRFGEAPHIRIEASLNKNSKFGKLPAIGFPFKDWSFRRPVTLQQSGFEEWVWQFFFDSCRMRGFSEALRLLPDKYKVDGLPAKTEFLPYDIVTPEMFAAHWPEALTNGQLNPLIEWSKTPLPLLLPEAKGQWFQV